MLSAAEWDASRIVEAICAWERERGKPPYLTEWSPSLARLNGNLELAEAFERDGCWPTGGDVQRVFGTWNAGIAAAGYEPMRPGQLRKFGGDGRYWTRERMLDAIRSWVADHGFAPNGMDFRRHTDRDGELRELPEPSRVAAEFGSFDDGVRAAGFEPSEGVRWTRDRIVFAVRDWTRTYGAPPAYVDWSATELRRHDRSPERLRRLLDEPLRWPDVQTVILAFGSLDDALTAAGFEPRARWTREMVVDAIHEWHNMHGRLPRGADWNRRGASHGAQRSMDERAKARRWPSSPVVKRLFGSHLDALRAAGYDDEQLSAHRHPPRWTRDAIILVVREWTALYGAPPIRTDWDAAYLRRHGEHERLRRYEQTARGRVPNGAVVTKLFGSFQAAAQAAGVWKPPRPRAAKPAAPTGPHWTRERIIAAIHAWVDHHGYAPNTGDWRRAPKRNDVPHPTNTVVARVFGSHAAALKAAGLTPTVRARWTRERIRAAVADWTQTYGAPPSYTDWDAARLKQNGDTRRLARLRKHPNRWPRPATVVRVFGDFGSALDEPAAKE